MAKTSYDPYENIPFALRSGVFAAVITAGTILLLRYFSPADWQLIVAQTAGFGLTAFWVAFVGRLSGSDVLSELGLNYPDLRPEASLHAELASLREAIAALERRLS